MSIESDVSKSFAKPLAKPRRFKLGLWRWYYDPLVIWTEGARVNYTDATLKYVGYRQMERAARHLRPIKIDESSEPLEVHFLTGLNFWYQTLFCAYSMIQQARVHIRPVIFDDGTLEPQHVEYLQRAMPTTRIVSTCEVEERLDHYLPVSKFPTLRGQRPVFPLMRKLTDIHGSAPGWKVFLDSDMLFHREPKFLLDWLRAPRVPLYMADFMNSYGYSDELIASLLDAEMPSRVNTGICGLNREEVDWEQLEAWAKTLLERAGLNHFLEQALTAMSLAGKEQAVAPREDYVVFPEREEAMRPRAVMHHYVADSRFYYYRYGWRHVARKGNECG